MNARSVAQQLHLELDRAIEDELDEIERRKRTDIVHVTGGTRLDRVDGQWRYRLHIAGRTGGLRPGLEAAFEQDERTTLVRVQSRSNLTVEVAVAEDIGADVSEGRIVLDARWLLVAQQRRIREIDGAVGQGPASFDLSAALRSVGVADLSLTVPLLHSVPTDAILNTDQQRLIELCYAKPLVALWGPPGTGKSHSAIHLISALLDDGLRVLYFAPTNVAVDDLLERGLRTFQTRPWWRDGAVIRIGPADGVTLRPELQNSVCLRQVVTRHFDEDATSPRYQQRCRQIVDSAALTAATVHQSYLSPLLTGGGWDVLIVDEASMVAAATLYVAAGLARRIVIAGDFRQLPPIAFASSVGANAWLRRDPYHVLGIPEDIAHGDYPDYLVMLRRQYRMAPGIADLVSAAYDHQLETDTSVLERTPGPFGTDAVLYVDSSPLQARVAIMPGGSRANEVHAGIVRDLLLNAVQGGALLQADLCGVLVLSPFVAQTHLLERTLRATFKGHMPTVRTIHRAQGREANVVILDLTDAANESASRFYSARDYGDESARLLTVAVTRARQHLIVIGDMPHMTRDQRVGKVARDLIAAVTSGYRLEPGRLHSPRRAA